MAFSSRSSFAPYHLPLHRAPVIGDFNNHTSLTPMPWATTTSSSTSQKWSIAQHNWSLPTLPERSNCVCRLQRNGHDTWLQHGQKLEVFRHVMSKVGEDPFEGLQMIDAVQRLGIDYYFQEEIEPILQRQFMIFSQHDHREYCQYGLQEVALRFRLLRQQGLFVPSDVFNNFKDKQGIFNKELSKDIKAVMGLYEASQLSTEGEDLLDEAGDFSGRILAESMTRLDTHYATAVRNTLGYPHHKSLAKLMAKKYFLRDSQGLNGWLNVLKELAITEFNIVQSLHQKEIAQISKWWRELGLSKKLKSARNQPPMWYICAMSCLADPSLSEERIELTKPISFIYMIDDIFDVYGTLDELTLFTEAVNRWDINATEQLPEYMKICFKTLFDMTNEISHNIHQKHGSNPLHSLRKTWAVLCNAFLEEAKWFASGKVPKTEDYLQNGTISSGAHVVLVHTFFLLGEGVRNDTVQLVDSMPSIVSSTAAILRLWDDLGSAKDENQDGHDGSYLECYVKEHQGSSMDEARQHTMYMISQAWKTLNKECLSPTPFPLNFAKASLNLARLVSLMYSYDDDQCLPSLEEHVKSMLYETVSL